MSAYYNEIDAFAAAWLRTLIAKGLIADGEVDERSIADVSGDDLRHFTQCHFFAGIGGWSYALRLAGWNDDRPVWTGSCPCQPFSSAGKNQGGADDRHLWPHWARLIRQCRPVTIFGEQVEAAIAHGWIDAVFDDLEREGYACGAASLPAGSVGAPHIRQRLWFVADSEYAKWRTFSFNGQDERDRNDSGRTEAYREFGACREVCGMADAESGDGRPLLQQRQPRQDCTQPERCGEVGELGHADSAGHALGMGQSGDDGAASSQAGRQAAVQASPWRDCDHLPCRDGKSRPVEPGTFPLAHGVSNRVGRLRGYGNAIVPQVAAEVIKAFMECRP